jgi:hypothetical protein
MTGAVALLRVSSVLLLLVSSAQAFMGGQIFPMARQQRTVTIHARTLDVLRDFDVSMRHPFPLILWVGIVMLNILMVMG